MPATRNGFSRRLGEQRAPLNGTPLDQWHVRAGALGILIVDYYEAFPALAGVYLEDSWVLQVAPTAAGVSLRLEVVLTPEHRMGVGT